MYLDPEFFDEIKKSERLYSIYSVFRDAEIKTGKEYLQFLDLIQDINNDIEKNGFSFNNKLIHFDLDDLFKMQCRLTKSMDKLVDKKNTKALKSYKECYEELEKEIKLRHQFLRTVNKMIDEALRSYSYYVKNRVKAMRINSQKRARLKKGANLYI